MSASSTLNRPQNGLAALAGKYLTFTLGAEEFGVPVLRVREIIKRMEVTQIPQMPSHIRGVVNLRGKVIPVSDLRTKFGLESVDNDRTSIIVASVKLGDVPVLMGVIVDAVSEVLNVAPDDLEPTPVFGDGISADFLVAIAKTRGTVRLLLDLDRVFSGDDSIVQNLQALA